MTKPKPAATASKPHSLTIAAEPDKTREAQIADLGRGEEVGRDHLLAPDRGDEQQVGAEKPRAEGDLLAHGGEVEPQGRDPAGRRPGQERGRGRGDEPLHHEAPDAVAVEGQDEGRGPAEDVGAGF